MRRPERLWDQYAGKALAELARGSGWWPWQAEPCALEPPCEPFDPRQLTPWDCYYNEWEAAWSDNPLAGLLPGRPILSREATICLATEGGLGGVSPHLITVEQFNEDESTIQKAEQLFATVGGLRGPVAFELVGVGATPQFDSEKSLEVLQAKARGEKRSIDEAISGWHKPYTLTRFAAHPADAKVLYRQLVSHYPNSSIQLSEQDVESLYGLVELKTSRKACGGMAVLDAAYWVPLRTYTRLDPDPLGVAISAMDQLGRNDWAVVQVLFSPARHPWAENLKQAIIHPYQPDQFVIEKSDLKFFHDKLSSPLFAVSVRLVASRADVFRHLSGWAEQFTNGSRQKLYIVPAECAPDGSPESVMRVDLEEAVYTRSTYRPGFLLNAQELASLVHLPSEAVVSERLRRVVARTKPAAETGDEPGSVVLGENVHRGETRIARISAALRPRHCYIAGASGTGKSTLLLNMIMQDIAAGHGVGVFDPHGDLVNGVLRRIPGARVDDVILFDPTDEQFPFALNILEAADREEQERIVNETIMALERYFPASWGPRLERILNYAIRTVLNALPGATLGDVERLLTEDEFRANVLERTTDARCLSFWNNQYKFLQKAADPVLNKLAMFLTSPTVRNIICQRQSAVDFDAVLNDGKILLANLSSGRLSEKVSGIFGSFLVTKVINAAFRRATLSEAERRPWYLYVDEFQSFMNLSVGFDRILTEARKYKLVLAGLANQYVGQLTPQVRQAIFGNVAAFIIFRLGVDDAGIAAKELGSFTPEEIMNLELGQAFARVGGSAATFNLQTYPDPALRREDPSERIRQLTRQRYCRPRAEVEKEIGTPTPRSERCIDDLPDHFDPVDPPDDDMVA